MKNNNKKTTYILLIIIIVLLITILIVLSWLFLSKKSSTNVNGGKKFGTFKNPEATKTLIPSSLKWKDPFKEEEKEESKGSYLHYLSEKNKEKK